MTFKDKIFLAAGAVMICLLPAFAVLQTGMARERAFFSERILYKRHMAPPDLPELYGDLGFRPARDGEPVARRFLARLPQNMHSISDNAERKRAFIAIMLPLVLRVNELIGEDRERLISITERRARGVRLQPLEQRWLMRLARMHGMKPESVRDIDLDILRRRVNQIPVSLALAQGAIESGWGASRFAREGNAIYGQWTWDDSHDGIVPAARGEAETHRIRAFAYLIDSVRGYANNLNRNPAYVRFRQQRERLSANGPVSGLALAETLINYSTRREDYVADLRAIILGNRLEDFDNAQLADRNTPLLIAASGGGQ